MTLQHDVDRLTEAVDGGNGTAGLKERTRALEAVLPRIEKSLGDIQTAIDSSKDRAIQFIMMGVMVLTLAFTLYGHFKPKERTWTPQTSELTSTANTSTFGLTKTDQPLEGTQRPSRLDG